MLVNNLIKKALIPFVLFLFFGFCSFAQNAISSTGGHFKSSGDSTSFTVGQVAYVLKKGNDSYLNEGVQQVYTKKTTPSEELVQLILSFRFYLNSKLFFRNSFCTCSFPICA